VAQITVRAASVIAVAPYMYASAVMVMAMTAACTGFFLDTAKFVFDVLDFPVLGE